MKSMMRIALRYFLRGVLYTVPLAIIIYILVALVNGIDGLIFSDSKDAVISLEDGTKVLLEDARVVKDDDDGSYIPGLGVVLLIGILTGVGYLGSTFIAEPIKKRFQQLLDRAPLVKTVYSSIKDLLSAFVGQKKGFDRPVLVKLSTDMDVSKLGFITKEGLSTLGIGEEFVAVYFPHSFNFSGNLFIVPKKNVTPIDAKSQGVMKFIVSGGVAELETEQ